MAPMEIDDRVAVFQKLHRLEVVQSSRITCTFKIVGRAEVQLHRAVSILLVMLA